MFSLVNYLDSQINISDRREELGKIVLVSGNFNILHPGHIRFLRFAKDCGDTLIVAVNSDQQINNSDYLDQQHRLEVVSSLEFVDHAFIREGTIEELIQIIRPWAVVKGKEYENTYNPEKAILAELGGKLIFSSGSSQHSSQSYLGNKSPKLDVQPEKLNGYLKRHNISQQRVFQIIDEISNKKVLVIGDTIVDQYVQCNAVGMSQEDPTIVVTPDETRFFLGGAGIVAGHARSMGASEVSFFSVVGHDEQAAFVRRQLQDYNVTPYVFEDDTRPTTLKTRYRVGNKTLLRVNQVRSHEISESLQETITVKLKAAMSDADVLLFSDFNYGALPANLVQVITEYGKDSSVIMAADSQTSSQVGDISRFKNMHLLTPTEREVRVALKNDKDGLVVLAQKLTEQSCCQNLLITLADEGLFIHHPVSPGHWDNDRIGALAAGAIDPAGAGDCLFAATVLAMASGANIWEASFVGSVAAACQVRNVGNNPIDAKRFKRALDHLW
jgi:rfaE bifunctional protein kinase chain/domain